MQDLNAIRAFAAVVDAGGFGAAARRLDMPIATVSRKVKELEEQLNVRLLNRTTRRVALTEAGSAFHEHCAVALREIEEAEFALGRYLQAPRGVLRVSAPHVVAQMLIAPAMARFVERFPQVQVNLVLRSEPPDPMRDDFDLVVRIGQPEQDNVVARPLGASPLRLYAGRGCGDALPADVASLAEARVAAFAAHAVRGRYRWTLQRPGARKPVVESVEVRPAVVANDSNVLLRVALGGALIAPVPHPLARPLLAEGQLRPVLPEWSFEPTRFFAVFASRRGLSPKIRAFVDFLVGEFGAAFPGEDAA